MTLSLKSNIPLYIYSHTDTLKSMKKYFEEYKNTSSSVLAKYIDTQIYKTNTHLRMIYATKCNPRTCILSGCSHNQYVHNPLMLNNRYPKYFDYFYSYIDTSSESYIHFELSDNVCTDDTHNNNNTDDINVDYMKGEPIDRVKIIEKIECVFKREIRNRDSVQFSRMEWLEFGFDYTHGGRCKLCKKDCHKNNYICIIKSRLLHIRKLGNPDRCPKSKNMKIQISDKLFYNHNDMKKNILMFKHHSRKNKVQFVLYPDFESYNRRIEKLNIKYDSHKPYQFKIAHQKVNSFALYFKSDIPSIESRYITYRGDDALNKFCEYMLILEEYFSKIFNDYKELDPTDDEKKQFEAEKYCRYCERRFELYKPDDTIEPKVKDHCHISVKYRGAAHNICNRTAKQCNFIPVLFHNLSHYDGKLIAKEFSNFNVDIKVLPKSYENYIAFEVRSLRFLDSYRFIGSSLEEAAKSLKDDDLKIMKDVFPDISKDTFDLIKHKGEYTYDKVEDSEYFNRIEFPPIEDFYSILKGKGISQRNHDKALKVYRTFECKNFGDYSDLYCKRDVILLADCFKKFREMSLKNY